MMNDHYPNPDPNDMRVLQVIVGEHTEWQVKGPHAYAGPPHAYLVEWQVKGPHAESTPTPN